MVPSQETEQSNMKGIQDDSLVAPCTGKQGQLPRTRHAWGKQAAIPDYPTPATFLEKQTSRKNIQDDSLATPCTGKQGKLPRTRHAWSRQTANTVWST